ncbi:MAG: GIY-YIG nuclease family protein [Candidatus Saganbacteria bacterium]|nr:GIY-YIG nuclease family protein [Candidatus Saganbacteria bacterium]
MNYYVYVLKSEKDNKFYIGYTANLKKRIKEHFEGKVKSTSCRRPLKVIFYEVYPNQKDALRREDYLKTSKGKTTLRSMLREYLSKIRN